MQNAETRFPRNLVLLQEDVGEGGRGDRLHFEPAPRLSPLRPRGTPAEASLNRDYPARGRAGSRSAPGLPARRSREMKPRAPPQTLGETGRAPARPPAVPTSLWACTPAPASAATDLCAKPWAAATGSTFRAGSAPGAAPRARPGQGGRRRRCGGPGSRAPTADAAAARSRGHPCRAPARRHRLFPRAARPGPGGGLERGRREGGAEEAASGSPAAARLVSTPADWSPGRAATRRASSRRAGP